MRGFRLKPSRLFFIVIALLVSAAGAAALAAQPGTAARVEGLRFGTTGGKTRIVIDFGAPPDFRAFLLDKPWRLAVDIPSGAWSAPKSALSPEELVKGYRSGSLNKDNLTRIVFDLQKPAMITSAFVLEKKGKAKDRLVIDLQPASAALFAARMADVHGNRDLKGVSAARPAPPPSSMAAARDREMSAIPLPVQRSGRDKTPPAAQKRASLYTVVIDAGHGGGDPGAIAGGVREKDITLAVARELRRQLEETGRYRVVLTRDRDTYIKLRERLAFSRKAGGDVFISIHADKIARKGVRGASIYTLSENASDEEAARLAEDENNAGVVAGVDLKEESQDVADILLDLAMREKMNESNVLAKGVALALQNKNVRLLPNSHRSAGFAVLKAPDVPAILLEMGFLSNPEEAKLLSSGAFQRKVASAIVDGVDAYFRKMRSLKKAR